jgi:hypothetical protein
MLEKTRWQLRQDETGKFMLSLIIWLTGIPLTASYAYSFDAAWNIIEPFSYLYFN